MLMGEIDLWRLFDIIGTLAFAVSGTLVGLSRRMDIFGISVLALATAVGGGMVRDLLVGLTPPMALRDTTNFLLSIGVALSTSFLYQWTELHHMHRQRLLTIFNVSDTIGLAAFTITGALTGIRFGGTDSYVLPILLAATTAVGGGVPRRRVCVLRAGRRSRHRGRLMARLPPRPPYPLRCDPLELEPLSSAPTQAAP